MMYEYLNCCLDLVKISLFQSSIFYLSRFDTFKYFLVKYRIVLVQQPPYSPDKAPYNFILFLKLDIMLKVKFEFLKEDKRNVTAGLHSISKREFRRSLDHRKLAEISIYVERKLKVHSLFISLLVKTDFKNTL